jgi:GT2 family glycosyltransferase
MDLSIIIPTRDRGEVFDQTLQSALSATAHINAEILVVNDSKNTRPVIPVNAKVRMIDNPGNGVAAARNAGASSTSGELILFLDDDIQISRLSIDHLIELHKSYDSICLNLNWEYPSTLIDKMKKLQFGRFMISNNMVSFKGWYHHPSWRDGALFSSTSVASFHLSMKRSDFRKTGGYNEKFPHAGFEDYDFPIRLKNVGMSFFIDSRVTVYHNEADRLSFSNWLASQERRAATRKVAVEMGYKQLALNYPDWKKAIFRVVSATRPVVGMAMRCVPNYPVFDPVFFRFVGMLQAFRIYKGYTSN